MQVFILSNEQLKNELLASGSTSFQNIIWLEELSQMQRNSGADVFIDLLFEPDHLAALNTLLLKLVIVNSVVDTLDDINPSFVRINAWPTFLQSELVEASSKSEDKKKFTEEVFLLFNKKIQWVPDKPGFITPRVISMIINEAFIALEEGVSTKQEIDTAMKLGTNYPYGPFEWAEKIGIENILSLLENLSQHHKRYSSFISAY